jgi:hypothetical protein
VLTSCSWFSGKSRLLAPISGRDEAALQKAANGEESADLCGLATSDSLVRVMAKGRSAVVSVSGSPHLLTLRADRGNAGKTYVGDGVEISLSFVENFLDKSGQVIGHKAAAMVDPYGRRTFLRCLGLLSEGVSGPLWVGKRTLTSLSIAFAMNGSRQDEERLMRQLLAIGGRFGRSGPVLG